jgi:hypothetical protein
MTRRFTFALASLALLALGAPAIAAPCMLPDSKDPVEKALCAHPDLAQLDRDARIAESEASDRRGQPERRIMWNIHFNWLKDREHLCPKVDVACLRANYEAQIRFWKGVDGIGPDTQGRLEFIQYKYDRPGSKKADQGGFRAKFIGYRFADPRTGAQKIFNRDIEAARMEVEKAVISDRDPSNRTAVDTYYDSTVHAPYQRGTLMSARITTDEFGGGAHGLNNTWTLNLDVTADRKMRLEDFLPARSIQSLMIACGRQIAGEARTSGLDIGDNIFVRTGPAKGFRDLFLRMNRWEFTPTGIVVSFPQYALGGMAMGEPECRFTRDAIEKVADSRFGRVR